MKMRRAIRQERAARETAFGLVPRRTQSAWTGECPLPWRRGPHRDAHLMGQSAQIIYSCARLNSSNGHERHLRLIFFLKISGIIPAGIGEKMKRSDGPSKRNFVEFANERQVAERVAANFRPIRRKSAARMRSMAGSQLPSGGHLCPVF